MIPVGGGADASAAAAAYNLLGYPLLALALAGYAALAGAAPLSFAGFRPPSRLERLGAAWLAGWALLAGAYLGLAMAGLFIPGVLGTAALLALAPASRERRWSRGVALGLREAASMGPVRSGVLGLAAIPGGLALFAPVIEQDAYIYHLGTSWQYLLEGRVVLDLVPSSFHFPLPVEMVFAVPLLLGDDRLAKSIGFFAVAAVCAAFAGGELRRGRRDRAFLAALLVLAAGSTQFLLGRAKNDLLAAAWLAGGLAWSARRSWAAGAFLAGTGLAAKLVYAPFVAVWVAAGAAARGRRAAGPLVGSALVIAACLLPWMAKTWLATGNPVYPFGYELFPSLHWDERNHEAWNSVGVVGMQRFPQTAATLPLAWFRWMGREHLLLLLLAPAALFTPAARRLALVGILGTVGLAGFGNKSRYMLPGLWIAGLGIARLSRRTGERPGPLALAAGAAALVQIFADAGGASRAAAGWRAVAADPGSARHRALSSFATMTDRLEALDPRRVIILGDTRTYRVPARVVYGGAFGESPLMWRLSRETPSPDALARRLRQLGVGMIVDNVVSRAWIAPRYHQFTWTDPQLGRYREFCGRWLEVASGPDLLDGLSGGFYLHAVRDRPRARVPERVWFLPGAEWVTFSARSWLFARALGRAVEEYAALIERHPGVGQMHSELGLVHAWSGRWREAYETFRPWVLEGMIDGVNLPTYGEAALRLGRYREAAKVLERCLALYPGRLGPNSANLALARLGLAREATLRGDLDRARARLAEARRLLAGVGHLVEPKWAAAYRQDWALLFAAEGGIALAAGERREAERWYEDALKRAPELPEAEAWRRLASPPPGR